MLQTLLVIASVFSLVTTGWWLRWSKQTTATEPTTAPKQAKSYRPDPTYMVGQYVRKLETIHDRTYEVIVPAAKIQELPAYSDPTLKVININHVFLPGTVFFGFGQPNVYLAQVQENKHLIKVDAKSFCRAPMTITESPGRTQSGVYLVPRNLPADAVAAVEEIASMHQGERGTTCVNTNSSILGEAGFTLTGGRSIKGYFFPQALMLDILRDGVEFKGLPLIVDIVRVSEQTLDDYFDDIGRATRNTPLRHLLKALDTPAQRAKRGVQATAGDAINEHAIRSAEVSPSTSKRRFCIQTSRASWTATVFRRLCKAHVIYRIPLPKDLVSLHLPDQLHEFSHKNPSLATRVKQSYLFSNRVVCWIRSHIAPTFDESSEFNEIDFLSMLPEPDARTGELEKYNVVVTGDAIIIAKLRVRYSLIDWILTKHVLISGYSKDVRYAGEFWRASSHLVKINNNSGTYLPNTSQRQGAVALARVLFPGFTVMETDEQ